MSNKVPDSGRQIQHVEREAEDNVSFFLGLDVTHPVL